MEKLFHVSKIGGLQELDPAKSNYDGKIFASKRKAVALLFGGDIWDDFDFILKDDSALELFETYAGAFDKTFKEKSCFLYEVEDSGFLDGQTHFASELVSRNKTKILSQKEVNLWRELSEEVEKGNLVLYKFEDTKSYREIVEKYVEHLSDVVSLNGHNSVTLQQHFPSLYEKMVKKEKDF